MSILKKTSSLQAGLVPFIWVISYPSEFIRICNQNISSEFLALRELTDLLCSVFQVLQQTLNLEWPASWCQMISLPPLALLPRVWSSSPGNYPVIIFLVLVFFIASTNTVMCLWLRLQFSINQMVDTISNIILWLVLTDISRFLSHCLETSTPMLKD